MGTLLSQWYLFNLHGWGSNSSDTLLESTSKTMRKLCIVNAISILVNLSLSIPNSYHSNTLSTFSEIGKQVSNVTTYKIFTHQK